MNEKRLAATRASCTEDGGLYEKIVVLSRCPPFKKRFEIHPMTTRDQSYTVTSVDSAEYIPT